MDKAYLQQNAQWYNAQLKENIMPFWLKYGLDKVNGGVYTCVDRDGTLMDSTKSVWFQGRFGYTAAYAYNNIEKNPEWLAASKSCIDFIEKHCADPSDNHYYFSVTAEGQPVRKRRYVFSDCFAAIAFAEYSKASGDASYADKAVAKFKHIQWMLSTPGFLEPKGYGSGRSHSITMILVNVALVLSQVSDDPALKEQIRSSVDIIEHYLINEKYKCVLESAAMDGGLIDTCEGRTINPGHGIETAWFLMQAGERMNEPHYVKLGLKLFDWQFKWGWDEQFGGIINFRDCKGFPHQDYSQDMKFWWPQCETVIAALYAYKLSSDEKYLDIFKMANEWMKDKLVDPEYGEWYGYLHRDGSVAQAAKGNLFKGPFHIPRMLTIAQLLINDIIQ